MQLLRKFYGKQESRKWHICTQRKKKNWREILKNVLRMLVRNCEFSLLENSIWRHFHSNYTFLDTRPPNVLHLNHLSDSILPTFNKRMETLVGNCDVKATLLGMKSAYSACQECIKRVKPHFPYPSVFCTKMPWRAETNIQANVNAQKYYFYCSGLPKSNNSALQKPLQSLVAIHRLTCKKILRIDLSKLNCILHQVIVLTVMHFQCNTQVQISCMNPCKLLRTLYALISHQSNGDCPFFFFFSLRMVSWEYGR